MRDLSIPQDLLNEAEALTKSAFTLTVPPDAEEARRNGFARWSEIITVEGAHCEDVVSDKGHKHTMFVLATKVLPLGDTSNGGQNFWVRCRVNYEALAAGQDGGQKTMSLLSIKRLKQIAIAAGVDVAATGLTGEILEMLFPMKGSTEGSPLTGQRFVVALRDNEKDGRQNQEMEGITPFEGD